MLNEVRRTGVCEKKWTFRLKNQQSINRNMINPEFNVDFSIECVQYSFSKKKHTNFSHKNDRNFDVKIINLLHLYQVYCCSVKQR